MVLPNFSSLSESDLESLTAYATSQNISPLDVDGAKPHVYRGGNTPWRVHQRIGVWVL
jgi:hypothetical protein